MVASSGPCDAATVAKAVARTRRRRPFHSLDPFNQMLAVTETVTHLRLLVRDGVVLASNDLVVFYWPAPARTGSQVGQ